MEIARSATASQDGWALLRQPVAQGGASDGARGGEARSHRRRWPRGPWGSLLGAALAGALVLAWPPATRWLGDGDGDGGATVDPLLLQVFGADFVLQPRGSFRLDELEHVSSEEPPFGSYLRVTYPEGSSSPTSARTDGTPLGGAQFYLGSVSGGSDRAFLRYFVRFSEGFDFGRGGKLPGLYGGAATAAQAGRPGLSARFGWSAGGAGEVYLYSSVAGGAEPLGRGAWTWRPGRWTCVEQEVALGVPGAASGSLRTWVDGEPVWEQEGVALRDERSLLLDGVFFSTFFGGSDSTWSSSTTQWADFAAVETDDERIGCSPR